MPRCVRPDTASRHWGSPRTGQALRSRIVSAISRVCCTAPEDGTVLIHFTGHGLSVDGADYLVPSEAQLNWSTDPPHVDADSLIGLDLTTLLKGCKAGTVLLTIDACRDAQQPDGVGSFGGPATNFPSWRDRVAVVFGCAAGQTCGSDELQGSHFTRALADALASDTSPRTVSDVISHTVRRTAEFARTAQHEQRPTVHYAPSGPAAIMRHRTLHRKDTSGGVVGRDPGPGALGSRPVR